MEQSQAAELKTALTGIALPAQKPDLLEYAVKQHVEPPLLDGLRSLPADKKFESLDAVIEELLQVQPNRASKPPEPHEESGAPPGGDAYTEKDPETGKVTP
jgi:hypothetical protein